MSDGFTISGWQGSADAVAVDDAGGAHTWGDIMAAADAGARRLAARLEPGARVALRVEPGAGWLAALLAIFRAGCAALPLSDRQADAEAVSLIADAGAKLLVADHAVGALARIHPRELVSPGPSARLPSLRPDGLALLLYTSGTTGRPKGVEITHAALDAGARALADAWQLEGRRALLHVLPLHHMHGIALSLLPCLRAGMRAVMLPRFDATTVWERLAGVDTFMAVPTMYHRLLEAFDATPRAPWREAAARLGLAVSGSAALSSRLAERWAELAGAIPLERWGMTEVGVGLSNPLAVEGRRLGRVGKPIGGVEAALRDGELLVRGPSVFQRYWRRPAETAAAFTADGFFRTGDAAEIDGDGSYRVLGRLSTDILKSGGYKLSALEIEEALRSHPGVADAAVVGLPHEAYGEIVAAAVVAAVDTAALAAFCRERVAGYKVPRRFVQVAALPLNSVGKVDKAAVRALFATAARR
jgi:malonyl-CoA/methylmalonyl-CoA synthetase